MPERKSSGGGASTSNAEINRDSATVKGGTANGKGGRIRNGGDRSPGGSEVRIKKECGE